MLKQPLAKRAGLANPLRRRAVWVGVVGLVCVVLAPHWAGSLIAALFTLFLVFAIDDEVQALEQDHEPN